MSRAMNYQPSIEIEDVLGSREVTLDDLTIGMLLASQRLPETMFQPYVVRGEVATPVPLSTRLDQVPPDAEKLLVRAIRNTLFPTVLPQSRATGAAGDEFEAGVGFR